MVLNGEGMSINSKLPLMDFFDKHRETTTILSKVVGCKITNDSSADTNLRFWMKFGSDAVFNQNPNFVNFGLTSINTTYKLGSVSVLTTRVGRPTNISNWIRHGNDIEEVTTDRGRETKSNNHYIKKKILKL